MNSAIPLAAIGMANTIITMVCTSLFLGFNSALDTLVSQAFGSKDLPICGIYLWRARIINFILFIPMTLCMSFAKSILLSLGQNIEVAE